MSVESLVTFSDKIITLDIRQSYSIFNSLHDGMLGNFACFLSSAAFFSKSTILKKFFQECYQSVKQFDFS